MTDTTELNLKSLGLTLPEAPQAVANYVPWMQQGDLLFVSGQISKSVDGTLITGLLGQDLNVAAGQDAARASALNILAQTKTALGNLDNIVQIVKLTGFVASTAAFTDHPLVINGASDLLADVLGERGQHTRSAVGVASLPLGVAVEIDAIIKIKVA
ncbi:MAG: RidA family protein [Hyphomicrobiaceae bacterium]